MDDWQARNGGSQEVRQGEEDEAGQGHATKLIFRSTCDAKGVNGRQAAKPWNRPNMSCILGKCSEINQVPVYKNLINIFMKKAPWNPQQQSLPRRSTTNCQPHSIQCQGKSMTSKNCFVIINAKSEHLTLFTFTKIKPKENVWFSNQLPLEAIVNWPLADEAELKRHSVFQEHCISSSWIF